MAWLWWLSVPVLATVLAACWSWLRSRPKRTLTTTEAMQAHTEFLDALVETARSRERGLRSDASSDASSDDRHQSPDTAA